MSEVQVQGSWEGGRGEEVEGRAPFPCHEALIAG